MYSMIVVFVFDITDAHVSYVAQLPTRPTQPTTVTRRVGMYVCRKEVSCVGMPRASQYHWLWWLVGVVGGPHADQNGGPLS